jgi:hypothetical protein
LCSAYSGNSSRRRSISRYGRAFKVNSEFLSKKTGDELWTVQMDSTDTKLKTSD